jgi:predicted transcriptional regulator
MFVESILKQKGTDVTISPEATIKRAADWLRVKNIGSVVVTDGENVLGLISEREIVHAFSHYGEAAAAMPVKEIMRHGVITVLPDESINRVMNLMTRHRVRHMPVLRDGKLAGIISIGDVVRHLGRSGTRDQRPARCLHCGALKATPAQSRPNPTVDSSASMM